LLIRLLALLGLLWTGKQIVRQISSVFQPDQQKADSPSDQDISDETVKDPVCQTYLPKSLAIQGTFHQKTYYFCSEECKAKFAAQQHSDD
jgi:YHS domain-containing protein